MHPAALTQEIEELLARWQHVIWWGGIAPVSQRMLDLDLTLAELITLRRIQYQPTTIAEVAGYLRLTPSAASRTVERLVGAGLLWRRENPDDRRQRTLTITPEGARLIKEIEDLASGRLRPLLDRLAADDLAHLHRLLAILLTDMPERPSPAPGTPSG